MGSELAAEIDREGGVVVVARTEAGRKRLEGWPKVAARIEQTVYASIERGVCRRSLEIAGPTPTKKEAKVAIAIFTTAVVTAPRTARGGFDRSTNLSYRNRGSLSNLARDGVLPLGAFRADRDFSPIPSGLLDHSQDEPGQIGAAHAARRLGVRGHHFEFATGGIIREPGGA